MKTVLLIASGAREHAIGEALARSNSDVRLLVYGESNNPGLVELADEYYIGSLSDFNKLKDSIKDENVDFCIVGPEAPLANGIADFLEEMNIPTVGPKQNLARLESSKSFTRDLVEKYKIEGNPEYRVFLKKEGIKEFMNELDGQFVIKNDGLKGGKGVKVVGDHLEGIEDGLEYAAECIEESGKVVIEEKLIGPEFSLMSFCDGKTVIDMPAAQDHKRAFEGDEGPNTGGMGSYSCSNHSLPFLKESDIEKAHSINEKVAAALLEECGEKFKGILYGGFILTKRGVKLIEYNVRFGDPEAENVLPILITDFVEICEAIISGNLDEIEVEFEKKSTVCKYSVPDGYPDNPVKDEKILIDQLGENMRHYYASVDQREDGLYLCGSRAVAAVGIAESLEKAEEIAQKAVERIKGPVFHRADIGTNELVQERIDTVKAW